MRVLLSYNTKISYTHQISDRPELVDKQCCTPHTHDDCQLSLKIESNPEHFLDSKTIKRNVENILLKYNGKNISELGLHEGENIVKHLAKEIQDTMPLHKLVFLRLQETPKYGFEVLC